MRDHEIQSSIQELILLKLQTKEDELMADMNRELDFKLDKATYILHNRLSETRERAKARGVSPELLEKNYATELRAILHSCIERLDRSHETMFRSWDKVAFILFCFRRDVFRNYRPTSKEKTVGFTFDRYTTSCSRCEYSL